MLSMEMNDGDSVIKDKDEEKYMDDSKKDSSAQSVDNVSDTEFLSNCSCRFGYEDEKSSMAPYSSTKEVVEDI